MLIAALCAKGTSTINNVGQIEHDDLLQLQTRAVIRVHYQHRLINELTLERHCLLPCADRLDDDVVKTALGEKLEAVFRRW